MGLPELVEGTEVQHERCAWTMMRLPPTPALQGMNVVFSASSLSQLKWCPERQAEVLCPSHWQHTEMLRDVSRGIQGRPGSWLCPSIPCASTISRKVIVIACKVTTCLISFLSLHFTQWKAWERTTVISAAAAQRPHFLLSQEPSGWQCVSSVLHQGLWQVFLFYLWTCWGSTGQRRL